jgi:uncharacterized membrane protein YfcA
MALHTIIMLVGAGALAGVIGAVVGGAAVIVYPALIAVGLTPQAAAISNLIALVPGTFLAALADRSQLPPFDRAFGGLVVASVAGAGVGASLLILTPDRVFAVLVPLLLGFATVLFAFAGTISAWLRSRARRRGRDIALNVTGLKMLLPVSFYGGYFGAGAGVLYLGVFALATGGDYRSANVVKNLVSSFNGLAAAAVFMAQDAVVWPQTLALMAGCVAGGLAGSYIARIVPQRVMRVVIVSLGVVLTVAFARRYWF